MDDLKQIGILGLAFCVVYIILLILLIFEVKI